MVSKIDREYLYIVEGMTDEDHLKKLGCRLVLKTGGKYFSSSLLNFISLVLKVRPVLIVTDPDGPGKRIREKILNGCPECETLMVKKSDSIKHRKVGIAEISMEKLKFYLKPYLEKDKKALERFSLTATDLLKLGLSGPNCGLNRQRLFAKWGYSFPDAKTLLQGLWMLGYDYASLKEELDGD